MSSRSEAVRLAKETLRCAYPRHASPISPQGDRYARYLA
jgi:hypothetical protein